MTKTQLAAAVNNVAATARAVGYDEGRRAGRRGAAWLSVASAVATAAITALVLLGVLR